MPDPSSVQPESLSVDAVRKVARLARLELSDERAAAYREQLGAILGYAERLRSLNLEGVEPLVTPLESLGPLARDEAGPTLSPDQLRAMAPASYEAFVKVPKVLGGGAGDGGA